MVHYRGLSARLNMAVNAEAMRNLGSMIGAQVLALQPSKNGGVLDADAMAEMGRNLGKQIKSRKGGLIDHLWRKHPIIKYAKKKGGGKKRKGSAICHHRHDNPNKNHPFYEVLKRFGRRAGAGKRYKGKRRGISFPFTHPLQIAYGGPPFARKHVEEVKHFYSNING